jgi:hypothetical protein
MTAGVPARPRRRLSRCESTFGSVARKPRHKQGSVFGQWTLIENLGVGGNGEAWRVRDERGGLRIMKLLYTGLERYERFKREIAAVEDLVEGGFPALPIEDTHLPAHPSKNDPAFYVMPEALPVGKSLAEKDVRTKVAAARAFAEALSELLQEHGRNHRDVKPANLTSLKAASCSPTSALLLTLTRRRTHSPPRGKRSALGLFCLQKCSTRRPD